MARRWRAVDLFRATAVDAGCSRYIGFREVATLLSLLGSKLGPLAEQATFCGESYAIRRLREVQRIFLDFPYLAD